MYFVLGATIVFLCNSEHRVRLALRKDIAERAAIEAELRHSKQQLILAIEAGQLGTWGIHGLRGMTSRAKLVGGQCTIDSAPGQGTQVVVDLPYLNRN